MMTANEVRALLGLISNIDTRLRKRNDRESRLLERAWVEQVSDLDPSEVLAAVQAHYAQPDAGPVVPSEIGKTVRAARLRAARDGLERSGFARERDALAGIDPDDVGAYRRALLAARGVAEGAALGQARPITTGRVPGDDPAQALCLAWVRAWRAAAGAGAALPSLRFAAHLGREAVRLVASGATFEAAEGRVVAAAGRGVCLCGQRRADPPAATTGAATGSVGGE